MVHKSEDYKVAAVNHWQESRNKATTCRAFKCSVRSLSRWISRFQESGNIRRHNRPPVAYKVTDAQATAAIEYLKRHQTASNLEVHTALSDRFADLNVTPRHLARVVRDHNLTRKRTRHGHFPTERYRRPVDRMMMNKCH